MGQIFNLTNPETMMRVLVYMVSQRQGSVPLPEDIHAILGVPGPDGITHLPQEDDEGGHGEQDDDVVGWGADGDDDDDDDDNGGGGAGGNGGGDGGGGGAGGGDDTVLLTRPRRARRCPRWWRAAPVRSGCLGGSWPGSR